MKRIAIVTGASRGLGATVARFLASRGTDLVINARTEPDLEQIARELRRTGVTVLARHGDLADAFTRHTLVDAARYLGGLDLLINNASELGGVGPLTAVEPSLFERVLRTNLVAPVALTSDALPLLTARGGLVVNVTSDAAQGAYPGWGVYGSSKAALELATRTQAHELAPKHVSVITLDPGDLRTRMHQQAFPGQDISDRPLPDVTLPFWEWLLNQDPMTVSGQRFVAQRAQGAQGTGWTAASPLTSQEVA